MMGFAMLGPRDLSDQPASLSSGMFDRLPLPWRLPETSSAPIRNRTDNQSNPCPTWWVPGSMHPSMPDVKAIAVALHVLARVGPAESPVRQWSRSFRLKDRWRHHAPPPCALPTVWPPQVSAAVSSSFIAIRAKVSRTYCPVFAGSGHAVDAFRVHIDQAHVNGSPAGSPAFPVFPGRHERLLGWRQPLACSDPQ